jgi:hypothetical protein
VHHPSGPYLLAIAPIFASIFTEQQPSPQALLLPPDAFLSIL